MFSPEAAGLALFRSPVSTLPVLPALQPPGPAELGFLVCPPKTRTSGLKTGGRLGKMEELEGYYFSAALSCTFLVSCFLFSVLNRALREPYMDEVFHLPQAQRFCWGSFQWDPMITTLPGLYLVSVGILKPAAWIIGWSQHVVCSIGMLRFVNLLFSVGNFYLLYLLFCKLQQRNKAVSSIQRILSALTMAVFPTLYFFNFLYYTEAGSMFFILSAYLMCLYGNHKTSALLGFCGFMFRQTNIVWTVFCAGNIISQKLTEAWMIELQKKEDKLPSIKGPLSACKKILCFLFDYAMSFRNLSMLVVLTWPYIVLVVIFIAFVVLNGGIVVGDKSNHEACMNFPQLFYFFAFTFFFSFPHLLSPAKIKTFLHSAWRNWGQFVLLTAVSLFLVWKFTYVHKYLLADNRHYTFYVWKRIFQRHDFVKYLLVPCYLFAGWSIADSLKSKSIFWNIMFFICLFTVTVPQKLFEFRYFILPYIIYRLNLPMPSLPKLLCELGFYIIINFVTFYLFLNKTFHWPNNDSVQRFMW